MVLPDTQAYTLSDAHEFIVGQQTRWIRDYRADLNTAFVAQVGDLVESHPSDPMWQRASTHLKVLDDAGIPNAVLPGNHDMDVATGEAAKFDEYFPPSRYERSAWTPSTSQYGGYLGQNLYGPDPVDRGNKDSFSVFSAGGMHFLVLSLEYEAPDDALAWAQKVIDNNPDRRVIVSTHGFIDTDDRRGSFTTRTDPGTNSAPQIWDKLIFPNCNIFMVVNGHWTSRTDPTDGEGRRTRRPMRAASPSTSCSATTRVDPTAARAGCATTRSTPRRTRSRRAPTRRSSGSTRPTRTASSPSSTR